ncbi:MAG: class I SAM-dependent methyltransferase [Bacteroidales bacterium]|jgi:caffeoyl-CoA O-methyltransferase|nr:class I SAM-dependent methyltransferase [Bacteroidales bacterium]
MNPFEFPENILRYSEEHTSEEDQALKDLYRNTYLKTVHPQMLSGKVQGQFLSFISKMLQAEKILEIGTFTGYSAYCLSKGLREGGTLISIEVNEELEDLISDFFKKAGIENKVKLIIGDALKIIPDLEGTFDLIFLDANKEHYPEYYNICIEKLNKGGILIADNVLWGGKVIDPLKNDLSSIRLNKFNGMVQNDPRVENVFLTVRDGLMLIRKL